jgi:hypothetical protein
MEHERPLQSISDAELMHRLAELLRDSRRAEASLVAHIGEVDFRRLYAREASPSMFAYCVSVLHLSEAEAFLRITAARASRQHPLLLSMLADGSLHLSGIALLAPHLTPTNCDELLRRARHRSKRQIEALLAELFPRPDAPALMRRLPASRQKTSPATAHPIRPDAEAPSPPLGPSLAVPQEPQLAPDGVAPSCPSSPPTTRIEPLAPARYKVQFTASAELHDKLERLQALMRSSVPDGDLAAVIEQAVTEKLARFEAQRFGMTAAPRKTLANSDTSLRSRHIPAAVRRAVRMRDGDRCGFVDDQGRRCTARERLELHHRHPVGFSGDHRPENISLVCRTHNLYLAELDYGTEAMARFRRPAPC